MSTIYSKNGIPEDLLSSDVEGDRRLKVDADLESQLAMSVIEANSLSLALLEQLRLLNNRFEEAFNTGITEADND